MVKIMTVKQVCAQTGLSRTVLWNLEKEGEFPRAVRRGLRGKGYMSDEVEAWIEARRKERDEVAA